MPTTPRITDEELRELIRARRLVSPRCTFTWLREAVGGGDTSRLQKMLRAVDAEDRSAIAAPAASVASPADSLLPDVKKRLVSLEREIENAIGAVREAERLAATELVARAKADAQRMVEAEAATHALLCEDLNELAGALDVAEASNQELRDTLATMRTDLGAQAEQLTVVQAEKAELIAALVTVRGNVLAMQSELTAQRDRVGALHRELSTADETIASLRTAARAKAEMFAAMEAQQVALAAEVERLRASALTTGTPVTASKARPARRRRVHASTSV